MDRLLLWCSQLLVVLARVLEGRQLFFIVALQIYFQESMVHRMQRPYPYCTALFLFLLRSAILAIRGSRTIQRVEHPHTSAELRLAEAHLDSSG